MKTLRLVALSFCLVATLLVSPLILKSANAATTKVNCSAGGYVSIVNKSVIPSVDESGSIQDCMGTVTIPSGVLSIPDFAFNFTNVTSVNIPASVTTIGNAAFVGADKLASINVTEPNAIYTSASGILFNNDKTSLISYPSGKRVETYTVPAGVTSIKNYAFFGNQSYGIILPTSVSDIEAGAFRASGLLETINVTEPNASLTSINGVLFNNDESSLIAYPSAKTGASYAVQDDVTVIEDFAFRGQANLRDVSIPPTVTAIGISAFADNLIESITFDGDSALVSIAEEAFENAQWLKRFEIPESVKTIGSRAFKDTDLATVVIAAGLESIGTDAFVEMEHLESITVIEPNSNYSSLDGVLFDDSFSELITYPVERGRAYYTIPSGVISISTNAFSSEPHYWSTKTQLQFLTIPSSLISIADYSFARNKSLEEVIFESNSELTRIGDHAFVSSSINDLEIPASVTSIGRDAFHNTESLEQVKFAPGSQLKSIGDGAFSYSAISAIAIPRSVTSIGGGALSANDNLETVKFEAGSQLKSIGVGAFSFSSIPAITIPASVTSIGKEAFEQMNSNDDYSVYFLGNAPATTGNLSDINAPAYIRSGAKGFSKFGSLWKGLTVEKTPTTAIVKPSVTGVAQVSKTQVAKSGEWIGYSTPKLTYQWYSCSKAVSSARSTVPSTCKKISGATKSTLILKNAQKGKYIALAVTGKVTGTAAKTVLTKSTAKVK